MTDHIETLRQHNAWRRGDETLQMAEPKVLGEAIDATIAEVERLRAELADAKKTAYCEVLAEWEKPWDLSRGKMFIHRLREMCKC